MHRPTGKPTPSTMPRGVRAACALAGLLAILLAHADDAGAVASRIKWSARGRCEPPNLFYSTSHRIGVPPCCAAVPGLCAGGSACPVSGVCSDGVACAPAAPALRPNVILMISDDQGDCHYGHARECRSVNTGTPIPAPVTPNLDLLAGYGTVFPVAHNSAAWCFPSLASIVTGRYQKSMGGRQRVADAYGTIATSLRRLDGAPGLVADPYNPANRIGGYCTFLGGKFVGALGNTGFDGRARTGERILGRTTCLPGAPGQPPLCGTGMQPTYDPLNVFRLSDVFQFIDALTYRVPDVAPARLGIQNFFMWYAPRIPHQPVRSPVPIRQYLFGDGGTYPFAGLFQLGSLCNVGTGTCAPSVYAFNEANFGDEHEMYGNLWWLDDGVREIREFLARESAPHCIGVDGKARFDVADAASCPGTWVADFAYDLPRQTIIMMLSDNGWFLPHSKHQFTENGHRTRMIVFDPRALPTVPDWDVTTQAIPPPQERDALAHAVDAYTTIMGWALGSTPGTQLCPQAADGSRCDGRDLRAQLATNPGGPEPPENLRHALCGHETEKSTTPTLDRYLLTRAGSVGRCTMTTAPACATDAECGAGAFCLGGHCLATAEPVCATSADCAPGAACLGGQCRVGPSCTADDDCTGLVGAGSACVAKEQKWCRNAPSVACTQHTDCPACVGDVACKRLCEPRRLKFYVRPGSTPIDHEVTDLFLDPDETGLYVGKGRSIVNDISGLGGPYGAAIRRATCCLDQWWSTAAMNTVCGPGDVCPADLTCNE
jgi:hypothetical protein